MYYIVAQLGFNLHWREIICLHASSFIIDAAAQACRSTQQLALLPSHPIYMIRRHHQFPAASIAPIGHHRSPPPYLPPPPACLNLIIIHPTPTRLRFQPSYPSDDRFRFHHHHHHIHIYFPISCRHRRTSPPSSSTAGRSGPPPPSESLTIHLIRSAPRPIHIVR